jgi:hypothetical protein
MGLQAAALERGFAEAKASAPAPTVLSDHPAQPFLDQGSKRRALLPGDLAGLSEKAISNLYGCLHMASHIILSGRLSSRWAWP